MSRLLEFLPFDVGVKIASRLLQAQGFGSGAGVESSGETGVFDRVRGTAPVLVDIGGFVGNYSAAFLRRFPDATVFLVEPSKPHMERAQATLAGKPRVHFIESAVSDFEGTATLHKPADVSGLASLSHRRLEHHRMRMDREEIVRCTTVDAIFAGEHIERVELMKIDVEGHELAVLKGAAGALQRQSVRMIQFEFGGANLDTRTNVQDFFYLFDAAGYDLHIVRPRGDLVRLRRYREIYEQARTTNYVAVARP